MSFGAGLSGVAAANKDLSITGNNIANASTTGFKASRAEFGDAYTTSIMGMGQDPIGSGVNVVNVGQKFEQGNISQTNSVLDLAIDGNGFFVTEYPNNSVTYTRSGIFGVDKEGYIVSNQGATLQGFGVDQNGIVSGILQDLRIDAGNQPPRGTHEIMAQVNVPAGASVLQQVGLTTRTNGLAVGVAQVGPAADTVTTLDSIGFPTTEGTPSQVLGGPIGFSGAAPGSGITFPWQPTALESAFTLDISVQGPSINGGTAPLIANIQPFSDAIVYNNVGELVASINANINGDPNLAGKILATESQTGGIVFETAGVYATDGSSIVSITDNVGGLLSTREYINFGQVSQSFVGNGEPGLNIVTADTASVLTGSIDLAALSPSAPFLASAARTTPAVAITDPDPNQIAFNVTVEGSPTEQVILDVPSTNNLVPDATDGWPNIAAFVTDLNNAMGIPVPGTGVGGAVGFTYDAVTDRLSFNAEGALGPNRVTITALSSLTTSPVTMDDLGFTASSILPPNLDLGQVRNDTLEFDVNGTVTELVLTTPVGQNSSVDALVVGINQDIINSGAPLDTTVRAFNSNGILSFTRLGAQVAGETFNVDVLDGPAGVVSTTAERYWGIDQVNSPTETPQTVAAIAGTDLFANNGYIDLTSDPGEAASVQGNNVTGLTFEDFQPGTHTILTSSIALPSGDIATGEAAGAVMSFSMNIGGVNDLVTLPIPAGGWTGATATQDFLTDFEDAINTAPNFAADFPGPPALSAVTVNRDSITGRINIVSNAAGIGPVEIRIVDQTSGAAVPSTVSPTSLGLAAGSLPVPTRVFGDPDIPANNLLEIAIDGGVPQTLAIPAGTYASENELVSMINDLINSNPTLAGEVSAVHVNGRLVFERTDIGAFPLDIDIDSTAEALEAFGMTSTTKTLGEEPIDRTHSFRVNLSVPLPDEEGRSGSVSVSLSEVVYSLDQLASAINRELAAVPEEDYIGVRAVVARDDNDNEVLQFVATEQGEASQITVTNVQAPGDDLNVNALFALLQPDQYDSELLTIGEAAVTNGYPEQSFVVYDEENDLRNTVTIDQGMQASSIATLLSSQAGVTATAETNVRLLAEDYANAGDMDLYINGQIIEADDFQGIVDEINSYSGTSLNSISASLDSETGDIELMSSIGIDISVSIETPNDLDGITIQGGDDTPPITLGRIADGETNARIGGFVDIVLNEGYTMIEPDPRVAGLFNGLNDASFEPYVLNEFDPNDPETYNETASLSTYDSLGNQHQLQLYYVKDPDDPIRPQALNSWTVYALIDGTDVGDPDASLPFPENIEPTHASFKLFFNADGTLDEENTGEFLISNWDPVDENGNGNGAYTSLNVAEGGGIPIPDPNTNSNFVVGFSGSTQYGGPFARYDFQQDGYSSGRLKDLEITDDGTVYARYTNGEAQVLGQVALASFANMEGLTPVGQTEWAESFESGDATIGEPGTGLLGSLQSAALEDSTVDLSEQLVHLIIAQRNYQASAKTIETANAVTQTIINLR
jgi:flagellar hook protein FlgE